MKALIKALLSRLPGNLSEGLQGWLWNTRSTCLLLGYPLIRRLSRHFGGRGILACWPRGTVELHLLNTATLRPAGIRLQKPECSARTIGNYDIADFADTPLISPAAEIVEIHHAQVDGGTAAVMDSEGRLVPALSTYAKCSAVPRPWDHPVFLRLGACEPIALDGTCVLLANPNGTVYFHWLLELLPRLLLMMRKGLLPGDFVCLVPANHPFIMESLAAVGIALERIVSLAAGKRYLVDRLLTTTDLQPQASAADLAPVLREALLPDDAGTRTLIPMIYVSRKQAGLRTVEGESQFAAIIERLGGQVVVMETLGIREQAALFHDARIVVAPHGSALANLVFCRPGTKVLELFSPGYVRVLYPRIGTAMGLDYWYLIGNGERERSNKPKLYASIDIDPALFEATLRKMME